LFSAIEEQVGLKLEHRKIPIDVIVVTAAQKPSENCQIFCLQHGPLVEQAHLTQRAELHQQPSISQVQ
jgi:hypothetical protein